MAWWIHVVELKRGRDEDSIFQKSSVLKTPAPKSHQQK